MKLKINFIDQVVGLFILLAIVGIVAIMIFLGANQRWFTKNYSFKTKFISGSGLTVGMPITLKGFEVGKLSRIKLDPVERLVDVDFTIYEEYYVQICKPNSVIEIASSPLGLGTSLMFHPGHDPDNKLVPLEEGSFIKSFKMGGRELIEQGLADRYATDDSIGALITSVGPIMQEAEQLLHTLNGSLVKRDKSTPIGSLVGNLEEMSIALNKTTAMLPGIISLNEASPIGSMLANLKISLEQELATLNKITTDVSVISAGFAKVGDDPKGIILKLLDPKGSIKTLLDDNNVLYKNIEVSVVKIKQIISELETFAKYITNMTPQITGLLEQGRTALGQGQDVLEALKNNPLLRGGVSEKREQPTTFQSYRDEEF